MPHAHPKKSVFKTILAPLMLFACASCGGSASSSGTTCAHIEPLQCTPPSCYTTWAALQASGAHCNDPSGWKETRGACDRYFLQFVSGVDYSYINYYDKASGAFVASADYANGNFCAPGIEGVPSAASCPTDGATVDPCVADAGAGD
jgi:hypothetical protein